MEGGYSCRGSSGSGLVVSIHTVRSGTAPSDLSDHSSDPGDFPRTPAPPPVQSPPPSSLLPNPGEGAPPPPTSTEAAPASQRPIFGGPVIEMTNRLGAEDASIQEDLDVLDSLMDYSLKLFNTMPS